MKFKPPVITKASLFMPLISFRISGLLFILIRYIARFNSFLWPIISTYTDFVEESDVMWFLVCWISPSLI